jgi:hypothetical protein
VAWQTVLNAIDAVESWIVLLPLYAQIPLLLAVLLPLAWFLAKAIDPVVEWVLRPHTTRGERRPFSQDSTP